MVVTIRTTSKETAKIEALVEAATANIYGIYMEAGEGEMRAVRTETADKTKTEGTGIKKETQAAIREDTRSGTMMILEPRIRK